MLRGSHAALQLRITPASGCVLKIYQVKQAFDRPARIEDDCVGMPTRQNDGPRCLELIAHAEWEAQTTNDGII